MELVKAGGASRRLVSRIDAVSQLRDIGERLDHVLGRYCRLVSEVADGSVSVPDLRGRVALINSHLGFVAERLQEVIVLDHELAREDALAGEERRDATRQAYPRGVARATA